jgi:hypothetical protein
VEGERVLMADDLIYSDDTLAKVVESLESSGLSKKRIPYAINEMQNRGILFRERVGEVKKEDGVEDFVIVLAYRSPDGDVEEDFGKFVNDIKALYSLKNDLRVYAVMEEAARGVLTQVEKSNG